MPVTTGIQVIDTRYNPPVYSSIPSGFTPGDHTEILIPGGGECIVYLRDVVATGSTGNTVEDSGVFEKQFLVQNPTGGANPDMIIESFFTDGPDKMDIYDRFGDGDSLSNSVVI
tara:strand:- start:4764 stop:5105 length:342 start_codon:yes stop_codon:yes gene_type:complete